MLTKDESAKLRKLFEDALFETRQSEEALTLAANGLGPILGAQDREQDAGYAVHLFEEELTRLTDNPFESDITRE